MPVAFFDLDKTVLAVNSATRWVAYALRHKHLRRREALLALGWLLRYRMGGAALDDPIRRSILTLAGHSETELKDRLTHFFASEMQFEVREKARERIAQHKKQGDPVVLLTSASDYLAQHFGALLQFDAVLATRLRVDASGFFTGQPLEPLCFGEGKLQHAKNFAQAHGVSLDDCTFYSDAMADAPVMLAVGFPVAVNPDPRLRRLARKKKWPIEDWGPREPHAQAPPA